MADLEYLLQTSEEVSEDVFFENEVSPWIEPGKIDRPDSATMSRALWRWLQLAKANRNEGLLPGQAVRGVQTFVGIILILMMLSVGSGLVGGMLRYDGRTFNVLLLFLLTVGLQWIFLILGLLGVLAWNLWKDRPFATLSQRLLFRLTELTSRKTLGDQAARWLSENRRIKRLFAFPMLQLSQVAGIAFNVSTIATLAGCVLFLAVRFGWETTPEGQVDLVLEEATQIVAFPWSAFRPDWVPTREDIENTRISWVAGQPATPSVEQSRVWYPFFLTAMVVWGLLPRILFWAGIKYSQERMIRRFSFQERAHREWWRRMTVLAIDTPTVGASDGAVALLWAGVDPDADQLRTYGLQKLRVAIGEKHLLGGADLSREEAAIEKTKTYLKKNNGSRVIIVAESWGLAPKDFEEFHEKLRAAIGPDVVIEVLLLGLPKGGNAFTRPQEEDTSNWQRVAADLEDAALYIRPCQVAEAEEDDVPLES